MMGQSKTIPHQMGKDSDKREKIESTRRRWSEGRKKYVCADGADMEVAGRAFRIW